MKVRPPFYLAIAVAGFGVVAQRGGIVIFGAIAAFVFLLVDVAIRGEDE